MAVVAGLACVAAGLVGAGEAGVGAGLLVLLADLGCHVERGGMLGAGIGGAPGSQEHLTQAVECGGLNGHVAGLQAEGQGLVQVAGGLLVGLLPEVGDAEDGQYVGLISALAELPAQGQGFVQVAGGLPVAALPQVGETEVGEYVGSSDRVI